MNQEEKDLLLKDLSARLPYGVKCQVKDIYGSVTLKGLSYGKAVFNAFDKYIDYIKPYLLPLSSMTEEQKEEFNSLTTSIEAYPFEIGSAIDYDMDIDINEYSYVSLEDMITCIDWLNAHHFDYRGLIEKGLAIDATGLNIY